MDLTSESRKGHLRNETGTFEVILNQNEMEKSESLKRGKPGFSKSGILIGNQDSVNGWPLANAVSEGKYGSAAPPPTPPPDIQSPGWL